ncbi:hypothetical protein [Kitasatospora cheerisanensis]|uniref:Uncharacterized protein n=1 Tax=Kitasatospora cheerisanensis KCTC 2395 TaxID=1348663 RepID=A0A066Z1Y9_9ACTN|nr:hypothetical protein [Kitasatospora cheerisanensis]KDN84366.1 hypothetical protein KCH_41570 [Kitasatospora cheerisanensis KCTC 2395]
MIDPRPTEPDAGDIPMLLVDTGNGPTNPAEGQLLAELFGPPNAQGVYGAPTFEGSTQ